MKKLTSLFFMSLLAAGMVSCSSEDDPIAENVLQDTNKAYMQFSINTAKTRSTTDADKNKTPSDASPDYEVGTDVENKIKTVKVVLVDPNTKNVIAISAGSPQAITNVKYRVPFDVQALRAYATTTTKPVNVIVYCNAESGNQSTGKQFKVDAVLNIDDATVNPWNDESGFDMNNADMNYTANFPTLADLEKASIPEEAYSLGTINVERVAARFDIAKTEAPFSLKQNEKKEDVIQIKLNEFAMFNLNKSCYELRRVSDDGQNAADIATKWTGLFGDELKNNYIVGQNISSTASLMYTDAASLKWTSFTTLTKKDNWTGTGDKTDYYPWRYAIENTFPKSSTNNQVKEFATGVVFKGQIIATDKCPKSLKDVVDAGTQNIYVLNDILYGDWNRVLAVAKKQPIPAGEGTGNYKPEAALEDAFMNFKDLETVEGNKEKENVAHAQKVGFKVFTPKNKIYEVYYNYWNRHNDNGDPHVSTNMEFAVVRNNVYKLKVSAINQFGDPDFTPGVGPIETKEAYCEVYVEIVPWAVRLNNIIF